MTGRKLDARELHCLQRMADGAFGSEPPCPWQVLERLLALGVIEKTVRVVLPLPILRQGFRLTPAGQALLQGLPQQPGD